VKERTYWYEILSLWFVANEVSILFIIADGAVWSLSGPFLFMSDNLSIRGSVCFGTDIDSHRG